MSTVAFASDGSKLQVKISGVFTDVKSAVGIPVPGIKRAFDDITNLQSPAGFSERIAVGFEFADISMDFIYDPTDTGQAYLQTSSTTLANPPDDFKIVLSNGTTATFSGYISWEIKAESRKAARVTLGINVTAQVTIT